MPDPAPVQTQPNPFQQQTPSTDPLPQQQQVDWESEAKRYQQQLAALQGRVTPTQQQLAAAQQAMADMKRIQDQRDAEYQKQIEDLKQGLNQATAAAYDPFKVLTPEEQALLDPEQASVYAKMIASVAKAVPTVAESQVKQMFDKFAAEQEAKARQDYFNYLLNDPNRGLSEVPTLLNDDKFNQWLQTEEGQIAEMALRNLASAPRQDMDRLAKIARRSLKPYQDQNTAPTDSQPPGPDLPSRLAQHVQRQPQNADQTTLAKMSARIQELSASRNPKDRAEAAKLLAEKRKLTPAPR